MCRKSPDEGDFPREDGFRPELTPVGRVHNMFRFSMNEKENEEIWGRLRELYLCDNAIDDAGVRQLALTPLLERLEVLYLRLNPISEEAAGLLRTVLGERVHL